MPEMQTGRLATGRLFITRLNVDHYDRHVSHAHVQLAPSNSRINCAVCRIFPRLDAPNTIDSI